MDNETLNITYNNGKSRMTIYLYEFLRYSGLRNIRKLIKLIKSSDTPDELEKLHSYLQQQLSTIEPRMKELANKGVNARTKYKELEPELQKLIYERERYRKSDDRYKALMIRVKDMREEIRQYKAVYSSTLSDFNALNRDKEKFSKLAKEILP